MNKKLLVIFLSVLQLSCLAYNPGSFKSGLSRGKSKAMQMYRMNYQSLDCSEFFMNSDLAWYDLQINLLANASLEESDYFGFKLGWVSRFVKLVARKSAFCDSLNGEHKRSAMQPLCAAHYQKLVDSIGRQGADYLEAFEVAKGQKTYAFGIVLDYVNPEKDMLVRQLSASDENFDCIGQLRDF